ncbi:MAG: hypothetical protein WBD63_10090 [Phycisphaerae bacterium]|nr:hypothetical protein [Phycisphaerae bacterium]
MAAGKAVEEPRRAGGPARRLDLAVAERSPAGRDFVWLALSAPPDWQSLPGQFVNVRCESDARAVRASEGRSLDPLTPLGAEEWPQATGLELGGRRALVRRPYSIARLERRGGQVRVHLLVQAKGPGSQFLASRPVGAAVDLVGPLGTHFEPPEGDRLCILVSGGCGLAPIFGLAEALAAAGKRVVNLFGATSTEAMPVRFAKKPRATGDHLEETSAVEEFSRLGVATILATDDGSAGFRGPVTAALERYLEGLEGGEKPVLYGCGPEAMLRRLAEIAGKRNLSCRISLERYMGCGIGVCLSCVSKRRDASKPQGWTYRLTCQEGPVVDAGEMVWDDA